MKIDGSFSAAGHIKSPPKRHLQVKWYLLLRPRCNCTPLNTSPTFYTLKVLFLLYKNFIHCVFRYLLAERNRYLQIA